MELSSSPKLAMFHCPHYKNSPLIPILSHINPVHSLSFNFFKMYFNIILSPRPGLPNSFLFYFRLTHPNSSIFDIVISLILNYTLII